MDASWEKKAYFFMVSLAGGTQTAYCGHFSCTTSITQVSGPVYITFIVFSHSCFYLPLIIFALKHPTTATIKKPAQTWEVFV